MFLCRSWQAASLGSRFEMNPLRSFNAMAVAASHDVIAAFRYGTARNAGICWPRRALT